MKRLKMLAGLLALMSGVGCTVVNMAKISSDPGRPVFVTAGDIDTPYESLGVVQVSRGGLLLFGFVDPVGTDIQAGFQETLIPEIKALGGDGAINVRFRQTQYTPAARVLGAIFFVVPLPSRVTITAEVVRLKSRPTSSVSMPPRTPPG
jgi:hypothetical protein